MISLTATPDRTLVRAAGKSARYLHLRLSAPPVTRARGPVDLAFVIDRSGSMAGQAMDLARRATGEALGFLGPDDRFAVVAFDDVIEVVMARTAATAAAITEARGRVASLDARGSTALFEGWLTGCAQIDPGPDSIARCLLLTDGHANVGEHDPAVLAHHAAELRARGVATTTFGLGEGFSEELLQAMASAGGGNAWYVEHPAQLRDYFTTELGEALEVVARDVRVRVSGRDVAVEPLVAYAVDTAPGQAVVRLGDLVANQEVELVVRVVFPDGAPGTVLPIGIELTSAGDPPIGAEVVFTFADHAANDAAPRAVAVDRAVARTYAADARRRAVGLNREGRYAEASASLARTGKRVAGYAHGDPELAALAGALIAESATYQRDLGESSRKLIYQESSSALRGRDATGRSRKSLG